MALRIDAHYATERILEVDPTKSCWLSVDVSSPTIVHVALYRIDTAGEPTESDTDTSLDNLRPATRQVTKNLLNHHRQPATGLVGPSTDRVM